MSMLRKKSEKLSHSKWPQKHLGINLTKGMKDLYNGNYKNLKKEIEGDTRRWGDSPKKKRKTVHIMGQQN
jgi:hypothetical protein